MTLFGACLVCWGNLFGCSLQTTDYCSLINVQVFLEWSSGHGPKICIRQGYGSLIDVQVMAKNPCKTPNPNGSKLHANLDTTDYCSLIDVHVVVMFSVWDQGHA